MTPEDGRWPVSYHSEASPGPFLAVETSLILAGRTIASTPRRALRSLGILVTVLAAGLALAALDRFSEDWLIYFCLPVAPLIIGVVGGTFASLPRTRSVLGSGTITQVIIVDGLINANPNGHRFSAKVADVKHIRNLPGAAVIEYLDTSVLVVPRGAVRGLTPRS